MFGTWLAQYWGGRGTDTLTIRDDGKYQQNYDEPGTGYHYQSDWLPWTVEKRESGYLWLHLQGMRRCDDLPEVCAQAGGGTSRRTIDVCEYVDVPQNGEVILVVTGADYKTPRGLLLRQTRLAGVDYSYSFALDP